MDCAAAEIMQPEAYCYYPQDTDTHVPCIKGEILPTESEKLPQQMWIRPQIQPAFQNALCHMGANSREI